VALAVILTLAINVSATRKYAAVTRTTRVIQATQFIPAGEMINAGMVKAVDVPAQVAQELVTGDVTGVIGKSVKVSIMKDQYLMNDDLDTSGRDPGTTEIYVTVTVPSGAWAMPGDYVDVWQKGQQNSPGVLLIAKAKVLHTVDSNAKQTEPGKSTVTGAMGNSAAVAVGIEVPSDQVVKVVGPASQNQIYLVRSAVVP
jgi:Flp pilus assembly protein CpaB